MKTGVILINLGTPDGPTTPDVRRYLREFLMDPYVVDIPWLARLALVYGIISPFRSPKSAHAYRTIWHKDHGSPLKFYHLQLVKQVQDLMSELPVVAGMRYGNPSLREALEELKKQGVERVLAFPLYPQYAYASTTSSIEKTKVEAHKLGLQVEFIEDFYQDAEFLEAEAAVAQEALQGDQFDHYLMSFHGVPERQVKKVAGAQCLTTRQCCEQITERNRYCYRAQCFKTARELAGLLKIPSEKYSVSFQSRLGRTPWIQPFTDEEYKRLAQQGVKRLAVLCPSFVADCLETLEEIEIRGAEQFRSLGGEELKLIPSLNNHPRWSEAVAHMLRRKLGELS